ncbi:MULTISPECIES: PfkB family carbohydrate kinase [unclassified Nocardia]|uniref:PfkB family carbohydrate kinase n=1 Tax=unclassified Nocardia TaxID=2637762 RepID=UPI001CE40391|nr:MULTISPECIES: carbohydrate kinase family protein [unclassified Nocardia]
MTPRKSGGYTVIGDAVVDHLYRTDRLPSESLPARGRFTSTVGGRGLNCAVAAARLGLPVRLIAAVGDDEAGRRILAYLRGEGVDISLMKIVPGEPTPVDALIVTSSGSTGAIAHRDEAVRLREEDITIPAARDAITSAAAVLVTFEPPALVVEQAIRMVHATPHRPWLLVQPTPPIGMLSYFRRYLATIDFLVGTRAQLGALVPGCAPSADFDAEIAPWLRGHGVGYVCAVEGLACRVRSAGPALDIPRPAAAVLAETPGARSAFLAALTYRLSRVGRPGRADFEWATAAMAASQSFGELPDAMPLADKIDRIAALPGAAEPTPEIV